MSKGTPATECTVPRRVPGHGGRKKRTPVSGFRPRAHPQPARAPQCVGEAHWLPAGGGWAARRDPEGNVHAVHNALFYEAGIEYVAYYGTCLLVSTSVSTTGYKVVAQGDLC